MNKSCENCAHWTPSEEYETGHHFGLGRCAAAVMFFDVTDWDDDGERRIVKHGFESTQMFVRDGSDYIAKLYTRPGFGCNSFEARLAAPAGDEMTDRELLELAAKAAGLRSHTFCEFWEGMAAYTLQDGWHGATWNPLTDDGDAFRLAVKLHMRVDAYDFQVEAMDGCEPFKIGRETFTNNFVCIEPLGPDDDRCAATRRAIVRAAARLAAPEVKK